MGVTTRKDPPGLNPHSEHPAGITRLWLAIGVIWSIGWLLFVAWREVVDQISPIPTDFFLLPLIILAPWLITASVLVGRWVAVGFNSPSEPT
jgi:hypothetical protein